MAQLDKNRSPSPLMRPFNASLPMALLRARESAMRLFRPMLAGHDLTEQQWRVLRALTADRTAGQESPDAGDLAERTFLLSPSLSRILANLEQRGLVERRDHPTDSRRTLVVLTDEGERIVGTVAPESERLYAQIESSFGTDRLRRLLQELDELARLDFDPDPDNNPDIKPDAATLDAVSRSGEGDQ